MDTHPFIAIEGAIGAGKTTMARVLGDTLPAEILLEVFEENPFLSDFYSDRARYAFQTQIFFLLSRYRQQHRVIADTLRRSALVSDYLFSKDWLFAHLNLHGDELAMYERVHAILGEQIPQPDLVIYLKASTDTLMQRIAFRDRPYERQMDRAYINSLRLAYDEFFAAYHTAPVLALDTDHFDIVRDPEARSSIAGQVRGALQSAMYQPLLPEMDPSLAGPVSLSGSRRLFDLQRQRQLVDRQVPSANVYFDFLSLAALAGQLGQTLATAWREQDRLLSQVGNLQEAHEEALAAATPELGEALVALLGQLLRFANRAGIDLETAYVQKAELR